MNSVHGCRSHEFQHIINGKLFLAPLSRGANVPFRRLCSSFGAEFTMGELVYARNLFVGNENQLQKERAFAKVHADEPYFGFQIATKFVDEAVSAIQLADAEGATWVDLNCEFPHRDAIRRGLGAAMAKKPDELVSFVRNITSKIEIPLSVKLGLGKNVAGLVSELSTCGVAAIALHGRGADQRNSQPADWKAIDKLARSTSVPIIGNGDILTWYEASDRYQESNQWRQHQVLPDGTRSGKRIRSLPY
jgi:tRNA-dihydrouridine synthase 3